MKPLHVIGWSSFRVAGALAALAFASLLGWSVLPKGPSWDPMAEFVLFGIGAAAATFASILAFGVQAFFERR
ncbi:MAG: hypothetical protein AAF830_05495 [Pseudomonadota bacterium]